MKVAFLHARYIEHADIKQHVHTHCKIYSIQTQFPCTLHIQIIPKYCMKLDNYYLSMNTTRTFVPLTR